MNYCKTCTAPYKPAMAVFMRCGGCAIINGKLPPTKYMPIKEKNTRASATLVGSTLHNLRAASWIKHWN